MRRIARSIGPLSFVLGALSFSSILSFGQRAQGEAVAPPIGRMLMVGFAGDVLEDDHPLLEHIRRGRIGGVILYNTGTSRGNITSKEQVRALTNKLREAGGKKLLIAVDEEGGGVRHVSKLLGNRGRTSARYLGERDEEAETRRVSVEIAELLVELGINLNLAPVLDLDIDPLSPAIGAQYRSYGPDVLTVTSHAREFIRVHRDRRIQTACKHFPGHGSAGGDSHLGAVDITLTWRPQELKPYDALLRDGTCRAIMVGHVYLGYIDPERPASLSPAIIDDTLRDQLGFDGVVITDDLQMLALPASLETRVRQAIDAGTDVVLVAQPTEAELTSLTETMQRWVDSGDVSSERVRASLRRLDAYVGD